MDVPVAQMFISERANRYTRYPNRYNPEIFRRRSHVGYTALVAGGLYAAGRLRMDVETPRARRASDPGSVTRPYGALTQGRGYKRPRKRVSFSSAKASTAGIVQLTRSYKKYKRARNVMSAVKKLDKQDTISFGGIWQCINPLNGTSAAMILYNQNASVEQNALPIHVFRIDDQVTGIGSESDRAIGYMLRTNDTTNNVQFTKFVGDNLTTTGRDIYGYQLLWARDGFIPTSTIDKTVLRHVKVDIMMRGIRTRPTTFKIQFVQFKREAVAPEHNWTSGTTFDQERTRFWTQLAKPLVCHPLANNPRDFNAGEYMKVIKTYYKSFQPDLTTNLDTTPLQHRMTIKLNLNRMCDYTRRYTSPPVDNDGMYVNEPETFIQDVATSTHGHVGSWKARIYMIISATVNSGVSTVDSDFPQYDISIRPVHTVKQE